MDGARRLEGYAAVFGCETGLRGFRERIAPGAFSTTLASGADILALVDHDYGRLLARTKSGTLRLDQDDHGLSFALDVPDTTLGRDVRALAERGDLGGMSFGFYITEEKWLRNDLRELRQVQLVEVSVVHSHPAYAGTEVHARTRPRGQALTLHRRRWLATL